MSGRTAGRGHADGVDDDGAPRHVKAEARAVLREELRRSGVSGVESWRAAAVSSVESVSEYLSSTLRSSRAALSAANPCWSSSVSGFALERRVRRAQLLERRGAQRHLRPFCCRITSVSARPMP